MNRFYKFMCIVMGLALTLGVMPSKSEAKSFPEKNIVIIVPHAPGGGGDVATRMLALGMEKYLKVPVIIKNMPGAGSIRGMTNLWRTKADGYTIAMNYAQNTCNANIFGKVAFDARKFDVVGQFVRVDYVLGVAKNGRFHSVKDIINSKQPVRYCASGFTSNASIAMLAFAEEMGFPVAPVVGFAGASVFLVAVVSGECDAVASGAAIKPFIDRGDLVPLMAFSRGRYEFYPDIPDLKEAGVPQSLANIGSLNYVLWAPPGSPKERLKILEQAMLKSTQDNYEKFRQRSFLPNPQGGEETKKFVSEVWDSLDKYKGLLKKYTK